ncbi:MULTISPECIES: HD domain-containing protein [Bacillaceae]|nr:HD domain-containing protein [Bacillus sp. Au-Bac7]
MGQNLKLPTSELELLYKSAILHDIGKIDIPDNVLLKEGKLTEEDSCT